MILTQLIILERRFSRRESSLLFSSHTSLSKPATGASFRGLACSHHLGLLYGGSRILWSVVERMGREFVLGSLLFPVSVAFHSPKGTWSWRAEWARGEGQELVEQDWTAPGGGMNGPARSQSVSLDTSLLPLCLRKSTGWKVREAQEAKESRDMAWDTSNVANNTWGFALLSGILNIFSLTGKILLTNSQEALESWFKV